MSAVERVREICLDLPEAEEKPFGDHTAPSFRVRDKLFVVTAEDRRSIVLKAAPGEQEALIAADPATYFRPAYVGAKGWVGVTLHDDLRWDEVAELIEDSYRLIAPKRLSAQLDA